MIDPHGEKRMHVANLATGGAEEEYSDTAK